MGGKDVDWQEMGIGLVLCQLSQDWVVVHAEIMLVVVQECLAHSERFGGPRDACL